MSNGEISFTLSRDECLVLFDFIGKIESSHGEHLSLNQSETIVFENMESILEREISEQFRKDYGQLVADAQERVIAARSGD